MEKSPNQFRQTTDETTTVVHQHRSLAERILPYSGSLLIGLGVLLLVGGGLLYAFNQRKETVVELPEYSPALSTSAPSGSDDAIASLSTASPSPAPTKPASAAPAIIVSQQQPSPKPSASAAAKKVASAVKPAVKGAATSQPAPAITPATSLPDYQPNVSLPEYQPQYVAPSPTPETISVTLAVSGKSYSVTVKKNATVLDVFTAATAQGLSYKTQQFEGLGQLVTEINGQAQGSGKYWTYTINGAFANKGADSQTVNSNDVITWTLS